MHPDDLVWDFNTQAYRLAAPQLTDVEQAVRNALGLQSAPIMRRYRLFLSRVEYAMTEVEADSAEQAMRVAGLNQALKPITYDQTAWTCDSAVDTTTETVVFDANFDEDLPF